MTVAQHSVESSEWYTPPDIVEAARVALGGEIDLDPATNVIAQKQTVRARYAYTAANDGLSLEWCGRMFLNPPSRSKPWWSKLIASRVAANHCHIDLRCVYVAYSIEQVQQSQGWTPGASMLSFPLCVPRTRVRFYCTAQAALDSLAKTLSKRIAKIHETDQRPVHMADVATKAELRRHAELSALPGTTLVRGDAPAHSSAIVGVGIDRDSFRAAFGSFGECVS